MDVLIKLILCKIVGLQNSISNQNGCSNVSRNLIKIHAHETLQLSYPLKARPTFIMGINADIIINDFV